MGAVKSKCENSGIPACGKKAPMSASPRANTSTLVFWAPGGKVQPPVAYYSGFQNRKIDFRVKGNAPSSLTAKT
jgi:hypothetical protein